MSPAEPAPLTDREGYYRRLGQKNMAPLWEVMKGLVPNEPVPSPAPAIWRWNDVQDLVMEAGDIITAKEAERRVLVLENPALAGTSCITQSLYAGLQIILPGEVAPSHRHSQSALRFVLSGQGAYTAVDGERTTMSPGDFVITPPWSWHDHGNESEHPMVWLDGLDVPLVGFLDAGFKEDYPDDKQPLTRPEGDSLARYGEGLLPAGHDGSSSCSPVFNYPYERSREALATLDRDQERDPCFGIRLKYVNPINGDHAMPTIGTFLQLLPQGFTTAAYRATDATVFSLVEGRGRTVIGHQVLEWGARDVFVVPAWSWYRHEVEEESVLFSFSNRPVQEKLGLFREQRGEETS